MKKRLLSLALALVMVCGLLPVTASAAVTVTEIVPPKYDEVDRTYGPWWTPVVSEGLAGVALDGKWGFVDTTGKEVVPCKYDWMKRFHEGLAAVCIGDWETGKWGFVDKTGKEAVPCKYDEVESFSEGLAAVELDDKWGYIDKTGKEVVPCKYDDVEDFNQSLAAVELDGKWGFIDETGKEVVPCKYDDVEDFNQGLAAVCVGNWSDTKWGFIDKTGKEVVPCKYGDVRGFSEGLAAVRIGDWETGKWGFIDKTGTEVVPCKYNDKISAPAFHEGLAAVGIGKYPDYKWGFIDKTGKEVVPGKYDGVGQFSDGLAWVQVGDYDNNWRGYIDKTGKEVVPLGKYAGVGDFSDGLAAVELATDEKDEYDNTIYKWGFIDTTGREVIPCKYDGDFYAPEFHYGLAKVRLNGKSGLIDKTGKEVVPFGKYGMSDIASDFVAIYLDGKWGLLAVDNSDDTPAPAPATTAYASTQTVTVDGKPVTFYAYALKEGNGMTNYIKLRDVAQILNGSAAQFQVGYDGSITITTKTAYTPNGSENSQNFVGNQSYTVNTSPVTVNGVATDLEAITLTDEAGGAYNYFKLRDLGEALGFNVSWDAETGISIDSSTPYNANN